MAERQANTPIQGLVLAVLPVRGQKLQMAREAPIPHLVVVEVARPLSAPTQTPLRQHHPVATVVAPLRIPNLARRPEVTLVLQDSQEHLQALTLPPKCHVAHLLVPPLI